MQDKRSVQKFFQSQNITIRKTIRQIDLCLDNFNVSSTSNINQGSKRGDVNILIVGPPNSGKSTLLRTMHYALNGSLSCYIENRSISETYYDRFEIKRNKRNAVQGLTKLKQTDEKLGVYGYQINFNVMSSQYKSPMDRYARTIELICNRSFGCIGQGHSNYSFGGINIVLVCLNMIEKLKKQEVIALRFFLSELDQKKIKFIIVGTHLDQILGRQSLSSSFASNTQQQKLVYIQDWKKFIQAEICPKLYVQIYCMQNYGNICKKQEFQNSEAVNFYSLTLLDKCIKKAPQTQKSKKVSLKLFCF